MVERDETTLPGSRQIALTLPPLLFINQAGAQGQHPQIAWSPVDPLR